MLYQFGGTLLSGQVKASSLVIDGSGSIGGAAAITGAAVITGALSCASAFAASGAAIFGSTLSSGAITASGAMTASAITASGALTSIGAFSTQATTNTLGNAAGDGFGVFGVANSTQYVSAAATSFVTTASDCVQTTVVGAIVNALRAYGLVATA